MGALIILFLFATILGIGGALLIWATRRIMTDPTPLGTAAEASKATLNRLKGSLTIRAFVIGFLALLMLIPLGSVNNMVRERHGLYRTALADIAGIWGSQQTILGPALVVPYTEAHEVEETAEDKDGREYTKTRTIYRHRLAVALPDELSIDVDIREEYRHRGLYNALVYGAEVGMTGSFSSPAIESLTDELHEIDWDRAYLVVGLTDTRAINEASSLLWQGQERTLAPGTQLTDILASGFHAPLGTIDPSQKNHAFELQLDFNGSEGFRFAPFGETTEVHLSSSWPHPSFQGSTLPNSYEIRDDGFEASWSIPHLTRNYPQLFANNLESYDLQEFLTGVDLFEPVFLYSKVTRAVKYGLLFIALTFLTFLSFELAAGARLHIVQYGLIGVSLALFYLTLLSLAEHISFLGAYAIAAAINIGMIGLYTLAITRRASRAAIIVVVLSALYAILFSLLHLESYALLLGTALLVSVVGVLMFLTRNVERDLGGTSHSTATLTNPAV